MHNNKHAMQCATDTTSMQCLTYSSMSVYRDKPEFGHVPVHGQGALSMYQGPYTWTGMNYTLSRDMPEFGHVHVHGQGHINPHPILFPTISKDVMPSKIHEKFPMGKYKDLINSGKFVTILFALAPSRVMNV
jgi:hypothetical protein